MNTITMNDAMLIVTDAHAGLNVKEVKKLMAYASDIAQDDVQDVEEKRDDTNITLLVRANHFDSCFAAALMIDSHPDTNFNIKFFTALPSKLPEDKDNAMLIGFTDYTNAHKKQLQESSFGKFTVLTYENVLDQPSMESGWFKRKREKPNASINTIRVGNFNDGDYFGKLATMVAGTLTDKMFCWLSSQQKTISNRTLQHTRIGACRLFSGAYPIVMNGCVDVGESLGKDHGAIERENKAVLYNLQVQLHHALRSKNYREALNALAIDTNDQMYIHAWSSCNDTYASSVKQTFHRVKNSSSVRIGGPYKGKPTSGFYLTMGAKSFFCTESMWPIMREIAALHSPNFISYHEIGGDVEWRVVCSDKAVAWAIAHSLGRVVWDDGTCIRCIDSKL